MVDFAKYLDGSDSAASQRALNRVGELARRYHELEEEAADLDRRLKDKQAELRRVSEEDLPSALDEAGLSEVKLPSGEKVTVKEDVRVSTTGKYRSRINSWLEEQGYDDLVKDEVAVKFGKGEGERAAALLALVEREGYGSGKRVRSVNPQTFAALLRELREAGEPVPYDELGAYWQRRAKLVR